MLYGEAGDDEIWGGYGNNILDGGAGNDILYGFMPLAGTVNLSSYSRTINYTHNGISDAASSGTATRSFSSSLPSSHGGGDDVLRGGDGDDMLYGSAGADILEGGRDNDTLEGGPGADWLDGGHGTDTATYANSSAAVVVRLDIGVGAGGEAAQDMLVSIERLIGSAFADYLIGGAVNETLLGMAGDDWLYGQGGADVLVGGTGNDQLLGGAGADDLYGQQGNDQFWFLAADFQSGVFDRIFDFGENLGGANFDYLRFEGLPAAALTFTDFAGYCLVSTTTLAGSGGVIVFGMTAAQLADQIVIA
ncbi:MAG: calcium-binding protein [Roseococcus sp.]